MSFKKATSFSNLFVSWCCPRQQLLETLRLRMLSKTATSRNSSFQNVAQNSNFSKLFVSECCSITAASPVLSYQRRNVPVTCEKLSTRRLRLTIATRQEQWTNIYILFFFSLSLSHSFSCYMNDVELRHPGNQRQSIWWKLVGHDLIIQTDDCTMTAIVLGQHPNQSTGKVVETLGTSNLHLKVILAAQASSGHSVCSSFFFFFSRELFLDSSQATG